METWIRSLERAEKDAVEWKTLEAYQKLEKLRTLFFALENRMESIGDALSKSEDVALLSRHEERLVEIETASDVLSCQGRELDKTMGDVLVRLERLEPKT